MVRLVNEELKRIWKGTITALGDISEFFQKDWGKQGKNCQYRWCASRQSNQTPP